MSNSNSTKFYTYFHIRNDTGIVFYVGKGMGNRAWFRINRSLHWRNIVNKHGYAVEIADRFDDEQDAYAHERYLIASLRALGVNLCNQTDGGGGPSGCKCTEETKKKHSDTQKKTWTGRKHSVETKRKMSESRIGNKNAVGGKGPLGTKRTEEFKARMAEIAKTRTFSAETRLKMSENQKRRYAVAMAAQSGVEPVYKSPRREAA